jgi:hypothetical protein
MASPLQDLIKQITDLATDVGNLIQLRGFKRGGTAGQVPVKTNSTDFNWSWQDPASGPGGTSDHGALTGLGDDDHPQYLNNTRADARYPSINYAGPNPNYPQLTIAGVANAGVNGTLIYCGLINGKAAWSSDGTPVAGLANPSNTLVSSGSAGDIWLVGKGSIYSANKASTAASPVGLTGWAIGIGEGQPVITASATPTGTVIGQLCRSSTGLWRWDGSVWVEVTATASSIGRTAVLAALPSGSPLPIESGGTGGATAGAARTALGAGLSGGLLFQTATAQESRALINTSIPSRAVLIESDCFTSTTPGAGIMASGSISGGACINGITTVNNPGVIRFRDAATTANSGFRIQTLTDAFVVGGGEIMSAIFSIPNARTTQTIRFGLSDQIDHTTPTKGAWLEIVGNGTNLVITGKTVNGGAISSTDTTYTAGINTWYSVRIHLTSASSVAFTVYNAAGSILWTNALSTAVPTTAVGFSIIGYDSSSDVATILLEIDYYSFEINRALIR